MLSRRQMLNVRECQIVNRKHNPKMWCVCASRFSSSLLSINQTPNERPCCVLPLPFVFSFLRFPKHTFADQESAAAADAAPECLDDNGRPGHDRGPQLLYTVERFLLEENLSHREGGQRRARQ